MPIQEACCRLANFLEETCQGRVMDTSLLSLNKSQPRMIDTSVQLWKSYLGMLTGVIISPYQQMECFTNKPATSWILPKCRNCSHLFGLMLVWSEFAEAQYTSLSNQPGNLHRNLQGGIWTSAACSQERNGSPDLGFGFGVVFLDIADPCLCCIQDGLAREIFQL